MGDRIRLFLNRIRERLWVKPLMMCVLSIFAVFLARMADQLDVERLVPGITAESIETLLTIISASMLVIAVFAVGSMLSAYGSASNSATPRSFSLVISDDVSQNALSTFIGAFIFSVVALVALMNGYYGKTGRLALFLITILIFAAVIVSFVRWIDRIARLGRLGPTIDKVEDVVADALRRRRQAPTLGALKADGRTDGQAVQATAVGYVQHIDVSGLQALADRGGFHVTAAALPGSFVTPSTPLAYIRAGTGLTGGEIDTKGISEAFLVGHDRTFDEDPRFGLIALSEIASRALSPAVNDPGTAIDIIGTLVRLFTIWNEVDEQNGAGDVKFDRVALPEISLDDMFDDAFNAIARDGASTIEVAIRLQKAFGSLASLGDRTMMEAAKSHSRIAFCYAENSLKLPQEIETLRSLSLAENSCGEKRSLSDAG